MMPVLEDAGLDFSPEFFEDEVRMGFYVPSFMKRGWAASLEVLEEFRNFAFRHGLRWCAAYGTLLGAVRHGGFVPWDDDIDIYMRRKDYVRLVKLRDELPEGWMLLNPHLQDDYDQQFGRIVNARKYTPSIEFRQRYHGFPYIVGIDIFILDNVSDSEEDESWRREMTFLVVRAFSFYQDKTPEQIEAAKPKIEEQLQRIEKAMNRKIDRDHPIMPQLLQIMEGLSAMYSDTPSKCVADMKEWVPSYHNGFRSACFDHLVELPFENTTVPVPADYNEVLSSNYGSGFLFPYRGGMHDYPFYEKQDESIRNMGVRCFPKWYLFRKEDLKPYPAVKKNPAASDMLSIFSELQNRLFQALQKGDATRIDQLLEEAQQSAAALGTFLETNYGRFSAVPVSKLENYCEALYELSLALQNGTEDLPAKFEICVGEAVDSMETVADSLLKKKKVVFLPFKKSGWERLRKLYLHFSEDPRYLVYVVPIPYFLLDDLCEMKKSVYEGKEIGENVPVEDYRTFNLSLHTPDYIISQNPYDFYSVGLSVDPSFYSDELKKYTNGLVYVPWFTTDEVRDSESPAVFNSQFYINVPGVIHSDLILTGTHKERDFYIRKLTETAGEETRSRWETRVQSLDGEGWKEFFNRTPDEGASTEAAGEHEREQA